MNNLEKIVRAYRKGINPPYSKKDFPIVSATLLVLLIVTFAVVVLPNQFNKTPKEQSNAAGHQRSDDITSVRLATEQLKAVGLALKNDPKRRLVVALRGEIIKAAKDRKEALSTLFQENQQAGASMILPDYLLSELSQVPGLDVEKKVTLSGTFGVFHRHYLDDTQKNPHTEFTPQISTANGTFNIYTNGRFPSKKIGDSINLTGYQINDKVFIKAVDSHETVGINSVPSKVLGVVTGPMATAVIVGNFSDSRFPIDMNKIKAMFEGNPGQDIVSYYKEVSFGKIQMVPSYFGPYTLPGSTPGSCNDAFNALQNQANSDINYLNYRRFILVLNCSYGGSTGIGEGADSTPDGTVQNASTVFIGYTDGQSVYNPEIYAHELGHDLGNWHASYFDCNPQVFVPPTNFEDDNGCFTGPYGDHFDIMGNPPNGLMPHLNSTHKSNGGLFDPGKFLTVSSSGTYTVIPYESTGPGVLALSIPRGNSGTSFTVEYRQPAGFDSWMASGNCGINQNHCNVTSGASIRLNWYNSSGPGGGNDTEIIDSTPNSIKTSGIWRDVDSWDGIFVPGKTFTDPEYGISIAVQSANSAGLAVQVTTPATSCVHNAPTYTIAAPNQSGAAGQAVNYQINFKNNDSAGCASNIFKLPYNTISNFNSGPFYGYSEQFKYVANPDVFTLAPGASINIIVSVTSPINAPSSTYTPSSGIFIISNQLGVPYTAITNFSYQVTAPSDTTVPSAPTNIHAIAGAKTVSLSWTPSTDNVKVIGYQVLVNNSQLYWVDTNVFNDPYPTPNSSNTYSIQAYDANGNLSTAQVTTVATPAQTDFTPPSDPIMISATATDRTITLNWGTSSDNVGLAGYLISYNGGYSPLLRFSAGTHSTTFNNLATNTNYVFQVQAYDADGNYSNLYNPQSWYSVTTANLGQTAPAGPETFYSPTGTANSISLAWSAVPGAVSYKIYRSWHFLATVTGTSYTDNDVISAGGYAYTIKAVDANGNVSSPRPKYYESINAPGWKPPIGFDWSPPVSWTDSSDNIAPTAAIGGVTDGQAVSGTINVSASGSDNVGVTDLGLYVDGERILNNSSNNTTFSWDTTQTYNGTHWLYVSAWDATGNHGSSQILRVNVNNAGNSIPTPTPTSSAMTPTPIPSFTPIPTPGPTNTPAPTVPPYDTIAPSVLLTAPLNGSQVSRSTTVTIQATASDNVGVTRVEFRVGSTLICSDSTPPYSCLWKVSGAKNKSYSLSAKVYDAAGNSSISTVNVTSK